MRERLRHDPWRHQGVIVEDERDESGAVARVATVFLTGRECAWRCVMCDLWRYTIVEDTPAGAIPAQIAAARREVRVDGRVDASVHGGMGAPVDARVHARLDVVKLYNANSFFDPRAVPEQDYDAVAAQLTGLKRVVVESHPALIGARVDRFLDALARCAKGDDRGAAPRLEVAMGLETAHPEALERLNKRITLERFAAAAEELRRREVALRVFLLIAPPFVPDQDQHAWLMRSVEAAFACGASVVSLIPTRGGNEEMEALASEGHYRAPSLSQIDRGFEAALLAYADGARRRVFVDLWDLERFAGSELDFDARRERLRMMNLQQRVPAQSPATVEVTAGATS